MAPTPTGRGCASCRPARWRGCWTDGTRFWARRRRTRRCCTAEAARLAAWDALARVPWGGPPCLLALARRDAVPAAATDPATDPVYPVETVPGSLLGALAFLGRAIGAALDRAG